MAGRKHCEPHFAQIIGAFDQLAMGERGTKHNLMDMLGNKKVEVLPSFDKKAGKLKQEDLSEAGVRALQKPQLYAVNKLHAMLRNVGHAYGALLNEDRYAKSPDPLAPQYEAYGNEENITLHFHKQHKDETPTLVTLKNTMVKGTNMRLGQLLYMIGAAAEDIGGRNYEDERLIEDTTGRDRDLMEHMIKAYKEVFTQLEEHGFSHRQAREMMQEARMDMRLDVLRTAMRDCKIGDRLTR